MQADKAAPAKTATPALDALYRYDFDFTDQHGDDRRGDFLNVEEVRDAYERDTAGLRLELDTAKDCASKLLAELDSYKKR